MQDVSAQHVVAEEAVHAHITVALRLFPIALPYLSASESSHAISLGKSTWPFGNAVPEDIGEQERVTKRLLRGLI